MRADIPESHHLKEGRGGRIRFGSLILTVTRSPLRKRGEIKMNNTIDPKALEIMVERFGHDTLISLATIDGNRPAVRTVNSYYEDGAFYTVTYALSNKMKQIKDSPVVAICGEWFTAHGIGENLGYVREERNSEIMAKLRTVFAEWYDNGHTMGKKLEV